jgi:3-keto-L-gulonate-6-phosphate decarboxylase
MSIFGKILKTAIDVVTLPVSVVADVVTLGGAIIERGTTFTGDHGRALIEDVKEECDKI